MEKRARVGAPLSDREFEVLRALAAGKRDTEISAELFMGRETVKAHVIHLRQKLRARNRTHAVAIAYERGLLTPGAEAPAA